MLNIDRESKKLLRILRTHDNTKKQSPVYINTLYFNIGQMKVPVKIYWNNSDKGLKYKIQGDSVRIMYGAVVEYNNDNKTYQIFLDKIYESLSPMLQKYISYHELGHIHDRILLGETMYDNSYAKNPIKYEMKSDEYAVNRLLSETDPKTVLRVLKEASQLFKTQTGFNFRRRLNDRLISINLIFKKFIGTNNFSEEEIYGNN